MKSSDTSAVKVMRNFAKSLERREANWIHFSEDDVHNELMKAYFNLGWSLGRTDILEHPLVSDQ